MQLSSFPFNSNQISAGSATTPIRILVVDDTHETFQVLKISLEPGIFEVIEACNPEQGLEQARRANPDMIVIDLSATEMDHLEVCRELRRFSKSLILLLSANSKPGVVEQALDEGVDDFLTKPTNSNILVASVYKLARRSRSDVEPPRLNSI